MFKIKKFLIIILFILTGLYSQTRDANWILTDSENYNTLSQEAKDIIDSKVPTTLFGKGFIDNNEYDNKNQMELNFDDWLF